MSLRPSPLTLAALLLVGGGFYAMNRPAVEASSGLRCADDPAGCPEDPGAPRATLPPPVGAETFCLNVGYLCAGLDRAAEIQIRRWTSHEGTMVVYVPRPDIDDPTVARALQRAAAQGVRAWNNQPFPVLADMVGDRDAQFAIEWNHGLGGTTIGLARTRWSETRGLDVEGLELSTAGRGLGSYASPERIRLTAAHEMGHALGLGHSDSERDVMYPTNTATSVSARDRRTMEVLYQTPDGTIIRR